MINDALFWRFGLLVGPENQLISKDIKIIMYNVEQDSDMKEWERISEVIKLRSNFLPILQVLKYQFSELERSDLYNYYKVG